MFSWAREEDVAVWPNAVPRDGLERDFFMEQSAQKESVPTVDVMDTRHKVTEVAHYSDWKTDRVGRLGIVGRVRRTFGRNNKF